MPRTKARTLGAALIVASIALTGVAVATSSTGSIVVEVQGAGSLDTGAGFAMTPGSSVVSATLTFGPHSSTGWHTHPGKTLVLIKSGTFTVYHARDCKPRVYGPGDAFVELPSTVHVGRNETGGTVEVAAIFFDANSGTRIDQPQPKGCDVK